MVHGFQYKDLKMLSILCYGFCQKKKKKKAEVAFQCNHMHKPGHDFPKLHLLNGIYQSTDPFFPPCGAYYFSSPMKLNSVQFKIELKL